MKRFEIRARFGDTLHKTFKTDSREQADRTIEKYKLFAKKHGLALKVALWDAGWLCKTEVVYK